MILKFRANTSIKIFVLISYISLQAYNVVGLSTSVNCSAQKIPPEDLPTVIVYDAKDDEPNRDNNGTVVLGEPTNSENLIIGWIGLECSHHKPIKWAFDHDYNSGLGDWHSVTIREVGDFYNASTYTFKAEVELKIHPRGLNFVLACTTFENVCARRVVQAYYSQTHKLYVLNKLSKFEEKQPLVLELDKAMAKSHNRNHHVNVNSTCEVKFSLNDRGDSYVFGFKPPGIYIHPRSFPDRQALENAYFFSEHLDPSCVVGDCKMDLGAENCKILKKSDTKKYFPYLFYMTDNNGTSRVVHAFRTLTNKYSKTGGKSGEGEMKFPWDSINVHNMMTMELPDKIHSGQMITITCHLSPFPFSLGSRIGYQWGGESNITFLQNVTEDILNHTQVAFAETQFEVDEVNVTIFCFSPIWDSPTEWANISTTVLLLPPQIKVDGGPKVLAYPLNSTFNASCSATGPPLPSLDVEFPENSTFVQVEKTEVNDTIHANIMIMNLDESHVGNYNCIGTNQVGTDYYSFEIRIMKSYTDGISPMFVTILIAVFASVAALFLLVVVILAVRFRMEKEEFRRLTEEAIRDFFDGEDASHIPQKDADEVMHYVNDSVKTLPYDRKYEVPFRQWSISSTILGSGAFAVVRRGVVEVGSRKTVIAVKTVKTAEDIDDFRATLLELKIMAHIGHHRHIAKLVAASTEEIGKRNVYIGVELCANGNMLSYLQKRKKLFNNLVKDGQIHFPAKVKEEPEEVGEGQYTNLVTSDISTIDLYKWAFQIASGMEFLESKKVLHADLAARNVLLTEELQVKISDFGLSRDLFTNSEYVKKTQVPLPWRHLSIESLRYLKFSSKSDVWSYGVTLYEMFTLGDEPYAGMTWNEDFITALDNGMRLDRPVYCTENMFNEVMYKCWANEPNERITFTDVMSFFQKAIGLLTSSPRNHDYCRDFC